MTYINRSGYSYYDSGGSQHHSRAPFLILASDRANNLYGCVRSVALGQFGHYMMGVARIAGHTIGISGSYGSDGLPLDWDSLEPAVQSQFVAVPEDIAKRYWHPEHPGWNGAGSEAPEMARWARSIVSKATESPGATGHE